MVFIIFSFLFNLIVLCHEISTHCSQWTLESFCVALRMIIVFIESLQHVWEANDSSSTFFFSSCGDDRKIPITILMSVALHTLQLTSNLVTMGSEFKVLSQIIEYNFSFYVYVD